jgi:hypothetical protein
MKQLLIMALLAASLYASDITVEYEHLGYGTVGIGGENMVGEILILAGVALVYIALNGKKEGV